MTGINEVWSKVTATVSSPAGTEYPKALGNALGQSTLPEWGRAGEFLT
jgi:hypothetical protein